MNSPLPDNLIRPVVEAALAEDFGRAGDITSRACIPAGTRFEGVFRARKPGRLAGLSCARLAIAALDPDAVFTAERVALNLMQRLSGTATTTAAYVDAVEGLKARITDTRKTTPGLRALEKYAVRCGGGVNHRFGLDDAILIKDNHIAACGGIAAAISRARAAAGHLVRVECEVDGLEQFDEALVAGPDVIMLDNFSTDDLREAVRRCGGRVVLEASGGVTLETVRAIAETGVDVISVGALTHSAPALDIGLDAA